ncbi:MAG: substrate-binding domain-containing protein [Candidatus Eremiobacteraeota bacterium]|nr:substrate-binding domain-containing protein [Candidatus Eremiobacteraeota bacterium]MBV8498216.1 substrate-binding domain-containing protein [Candidatus Eremiobacteraeota bacterium]
MNKRLATLALAALPALVLSACNGGTGGGNSALAPLPNSAQASHAGRAHGLDNGPKDLHAGGATFPAYAYNLASQPVGLGTQPQAPPGQGSLFYAAPTNGTIFYCLTGSGYGRAEFTTNNGTATTACAALGASPTGFGARVDPLDFVGSDVALKSSEYTTYKANRESGSVQWGEPFEFPTIGGPIVYGFRPQDFVPSNIKLSTWTYCAITNGTVSDWNDPAITADNGSSVTGGVSQTISFFFRSDSSGTSYLFTNHLNTACNVAFKPPYNKPPYGSPSRSAAWTYGVSSTWPGPGSSGNPNPHFTGESGNPGVLAAIQATAFGTGYVEGAYAASASPAVSQALLQNGYSKTTGAIWTDPTNKKQVKGALKKVTSKAITYGEGSDSVPLGTSAPWCILYIDPKNWVSPPTNTYPIVGVSYWLFYGKNNGVHVGDKKAIINYLATSKNAARIIDKLEYIPLPASIHTAITNALNGNGGSEPACLQ